MITILMKQNIIFLLTNEKVQEKYVKDSKSFY